MKTLRDIEIFYPGNWNGDEYTEADVIEMVNTANECALYIQPQLSLNHKQVAPDIIKQASFGAVMHFTLRTLDGIKRIFCDIGRVRDELADLLLYHYPRRSIDLWTSWDHPEKHRTFRNVIIGVSFLGAKMPPAVEGMLPEFAVAFRQPAHRDGAVTIVIGDRPMSTQFSKQPPAAGSTFATRRAELGFTVADVLSRVNADQAQPAIAEQTILDIEAGLVQPTSAVTERLAAALESDPKQFTTNDPQTLIKQVETTVLNSMKQMLRQFQAEGETLGAYLQAVIVEKGLNAEEVAQACEITPEQFTAYLKGEFIADADLEMIAKVLQLDLEDVRQRRGERPAQENESAANSGAADQQFRKQLDTALAPYKREMLQFKRERDAERQRNRELETDQFLHQLVTQFKASKALTGETARTLLLTLDDTQVKQFAKESQPETPRAAFQRFLETLARIGLVTVPTGQIAEPKPEEKQFASDPAELKKQIEAYQKQHNVATFHEAQRLMLADTTWGGQ